MMKHTGLLAFGGAVVGFAGVFLAHGQPSHSTVNGQPGSSPTGSASTGRPTTPSTSSASHGTTGGANHTATGTTEQYGYGELAVRVTVRGKRITHVSVPTLRTADPLSQQIAHAAIPTLRSEVLSAQSAHINAVSSATITSEAYAASLQSALDKLHLK